MIAAYLQVIYFSTQFFTIQSEAIHVGSKSQRVLRCQNVSHTHDEPSLEWLESHWISNHQVDPHSFI